MYRVKIYETLTEEEIVAVNVTGISILFGRATLTFKDGSNSYLQLENYDIKIRYRKELEK